MTSATRPLGTKEVSQQLGIPEQTLRWWRHVGRGPRSFKIGRHVAYMPSDVDSWLADQYAATAVGE